MSAHRPHPVVVTVPSDDDLESVVHYAAAEAAVHGCGIRLVHAHPPGEEGRAELVLARARAVAGLLSGPAVQISTRRVAGQPVQAVLAADLDARAVVLRRRDSLHLMRALAEGSSGIGGRPAVACVPGDWSPWRRDPRAVLLAIDDPADAAASIGVGLEVARSHGTALRVLHTWHLAGRDDAAVAARVSPELTRSLHDSLRAELERARLQAGPSEVPVDLEVVHGIAAEVVVRAARDAQVLLLGRNEPGPDGSVHLGRTSRAALHECPCPVVLLESSRRPAEPPSRARPTDPLLVTAGASRSQH